MFVRKMAFYNRSEPYYRMLYGGAATVDGNGRIYIHYHSRDRRKGDLIYSPEGVPIQWTISAHRWPCGEALTVQP